jgi:hypothetical protein
MYLTHLAQERGDKLSGSMKGEKISYLAEWL